MSTPMSPEQTKQIAESVYAGRKLDAIKQYREHTGQGLKESKDFIEALERELRAKDPARFTAPPAGKGCLGAAVLLSVGALVIAVMGFLW